MLAFRIEDVFIIYYQIERWNIFPEKFEIGRRIHAVGLRRVCLSEDGVLIYPAVNP